MWLREAGRRTDGLFAVTETDGKIAMSLKKYGPTLVTLSRQIVFGAHRGVAWFFRLGTHRKHKENERRRREALGGSGGMISVPRGHSNFAVIISTFCDKFLNSICNSNVHFFFSRLFSALNSAFTFPLFYDCFRVIPFCILQLFSSPFQVCFLYFVFRIL